MGAYSVLRFLYGCWFRCGKICWLSLVNREESYLRLGCAFVLLGAVACKCLPDGTSSHPRYFLPSHPFLAHLACMFEQYVPHIFHRTARRCLYGRPGFTVVCLAALIFDTLPLLGTFCLSSGSVCCHRDEGHSYF